MPKRETVTAEDTGPALIAAIAGVITEFRKRHGLTNLQLARRVYRRYRKVLPPLRVQQLEWFIGSLQSGAVSIAPEFFTIIMLSMDEDPAGAFETVIARGEATQASQAKSGRRWKAARARGAAVSLA